MKKKVTIQDIADALGISRNTVSNAINNSDGLADATRERILQKAVEMGYKQFSYISTLTRAVPTVQVEPPNTPMNHGEISLFTTFFPSQSHFGSLMLDRFQREIMQLGYTLNAHRVTPENLRDHTLPITFIPERCAGILCIEMFDRDYDQMLCELGFPLLFVDTPPRIDGFTLPADQLLMDNTGELTRLLTDLIHQGYRRFGWIGSYNHCQSFYERYSALRLTALMAGIPVEEQFILNTNSEIETNMMLSRLSELPDIFLCANDFIAAHAVLILSTLGKKVPDDVMICGFDDAPESRIVVPALTTVHIHTQIMAFSAVHLLISRMKEPSLDFRVIHTETNLVCRASTNICKERKHP